jgi:hypothetical protein
MENKAQVLTVVLSAISAISVAFIGFYGSMRLEQIRNQLVTETQAQTIQLEQQKLDAQQRGRLEKNLIAYVPKLVGLNEGDRKEAVAVLFILYPNDARDIIHRATASLSDDQKIVFQPTIEKAEALAVDTGSWTIVIGSDSTLESAQFEARNAAKKGYTPAVIYKRDKWFVTTVGSYPTQELAQSDTIAVRSKIRSSAFPVNLNSWCLNRKQGNDYTECVAK